MNPETIAQIVLRSLELAIIIAKNIPPEQHARFWEEQEKVRQFWQKVFEQLQLPDKKDKP